MSRLPRLSRRLVLEAPQRVADGAGGWSEAWQVLGTLPAEVIAGAGRERAGQGAALSRMAYRITVRGAPVGASFRPQAGQRFREGGRVFHIQAVAERDPRGAYLICFAEEENAA
ncbi:head-tail adaptor protein [Actibacterium sp. XHP0104]|uniref:head-tail adaptor protein n=1 Tax=Actibacterium sp. XHP0104 TaxID=2984335 RepID=UPI0021E7038E|nr:head-tail adaptor protein [Actibacterium sp. XHP0104]MCV2880979.1 head-tail adaptor protein [Actibacterium sp. XHP0104]